jgi:hypothetical protein
VNAEQIALASMKLDLQHLRADYERVHTSHARRAVSSAVSDLSDKVQAMERRLMSVLPTLVIDGVEISMPKGMQCYEGQRHHVQNGILFILEQRKGTREAGTFAKGTEFSWYNYAWLPNGNKFSKLCVRMLGGDGYGDRIQCSVTHYKHPSDQHCYMETQIYPHSHFYKPYVEYIIKEIAGWTFEHLKKN